MKLITRLVPIAFVVWQVSLSLVLAEPDDDTDVTSIPKWSQEAVWYQIFVERFRNGDATNDPTLADIEGAWPHLKIESWKPTAWGQDWYRQEAWAKASGEPFYKTVYMRRYGGDLQGVIDRLDYLKQIGVTAIYLNPVNDSPSLHKYDARHYRHVDRNFGPDPEGDLQLIQQEDPADPAAWKWTAADKLLLQLIAEVHRRNMRIILDYSWNHTGSKFWAWKDVVAKQQKSKFKDWYEIESFDDPSTEENEFHYRGWSGVKTLPEFKRVKRSDGKLDLPSAVKQHIRAVTRRWLDPNGDGDSSDGVDGFRLDVAAEVPIAFWHDYRQFVRSINPDCFLLGEIWWEKWPHKLKDPAPYLMAERPVFDAVMNYRWYVAARGLLGVGQRKQTPASYPNRIKDLSQGIQPPAARAMMNLVSGHDSPRLSTSLYNPGLYKYRVNPRQNRDYKIDRPKTIDADRRLMLIHQFTSIGSPQIYYGDEVGMWGPDDPDNRKPMVWPDIQYEPETTAPLGIGRTPDTVAVDHELLAFVRNLAQLRHRYGHLFAYGKLEFVAASDPEVLIYRRIANMEQVYVVMNLARNAKTVPLPATSLVDLLSDQTLSGTLKLAPRSARIVAAKR